MRTAEKIIMSVIVLLLILPLSLGVSCLESLEPNSVLVSHAEFLNELTRDGVNQPDAAARMAYKQAIKERLANYVDAETADTFLSDLDSRSTLEIATVFYALGDVKNKYGISDNEIKDAVADKNFVELLNERVDRAAATAAGEIKGTVLNQGTGYEEAELVSGGINPEGTEPTIDDRIANVVVPAAAERLREKLAQESNPVLEIIVNSENILRDVFEGVASGEEAKNLIQYISSELDEEDQRKLERELKKYHPLDPEVAERKYPRGMSSLENYMQFSTKIKNIATSLDLQGYELEDNLVLVGSSVQNTKFEEDSDYDISIIVAQEEFDVLAKAIKDTLPDYRTRDHKKLETAINKGIIGKKWINRLSPKTSDGWFIFLNELNEYQDELGRDIQVSLIVRNSRFDSTVSLPLAVGS